MVLQCIPYHGTNDYTNAQLTHRGGIMRITSDVADFLKTYGRAKKFSRGDLIVHEGEYSDTVFIILDGTAEIVKAGAGGHEVVIAETGRGAVFGEMGAFLNYKRSASVRAKTEMTVIMFTSQSFIQALFKLPDLTLRVIKSFANRVQELNEKLMHASYTKLMIVVGVSIVEQFRETECAIDDDGCTEMAFSVLKLKSATRLEMPKINAALKQLEQQEIIVSMLEDGDGGYLMKLRIEKLLRYINEISYVEEA